MKIKLLILFFLPLMAFSQSAKMKAKVNKTTNTVEVLADGKPFTTFIYDNRDGLKKPVLFPIYSPQNQLITRGWPLAPRPGERIDHPHHVGLWFNYEDLNGDDYWNNSNTPPHPTATYGTIVTKSWKLLRKGGKTVDLVFEADWVSSKNEVVVKEFTTYRFSGSKSSRIIDRTTRLTAVKDAYFKDVKDGLIGLRISRELEQPSNKAEVFTDVNGVATTVPQMNNEGVTGSYLNSNDVVGDDTWGKRAEWVNLRGTIKGEKLNVIIIDYPKNPGYPTYWHARGYGLFAANPMGQKIFSNGKESLDLKLAPGESTTFKYRVAIVDGDMTKQNVEALKEDFWKSR